MLSACGARRVHRPRFLHGAGSLGVTGARGERSARRSRPPRGPGRQRDLDPAVADAHGPGLERALGRAGGRMPVAHVEAGAVRDAHELAALERAIAHRPGRVRAAQRDGVDRAFDPTQGDLAPVRLDGEEPALAELLVAGDGMMGDGEVFHGGAA